MRLALLVQAVVALFISRTDLVQAVVVTHIKDVSSFSHVLTS